LDFDTSRGGRVAGLDEFMAVTTVGNVVKVNTEDINVAIVLSSVDRKGD